MDVFMCNTYDDKVTIDPYYLINTAIASDNNPSSATGCVTLSLMKILSVHLLKKFLVDLLWLSSFKQQTNLKV
jgi:hypothetical protein